MANKIHFRATIGGKTVCATRPVGNGKMRNNNRQTYGTIPSHHVVGPEEFRAVAPENRCAHCSEQFTDTMNRRRKISGKPLYKNAFTKELA